MSVLLDIPDYIFLHQQRRVSMKTLPLPQMTVQPSQYTNLSGIFSIEQTDRLLNDWETERYQPGTDILKRTMSCAEIKIIRLTIILK